MGPAAGLTTEPKGGTWAAAGLALGQRGVRVIYAKRSNSTPTESALLLGVGNRSQGDQALGPLAADRIEALLLPGLRVEATLELQIEDVTSIARHPLVVFVVAAMMGGRAFGLAELRPSLAATWGRYTSRHLDPAAALGLAHRLFGAKTRGFVLTIRGYDFEGFGAPPSLGAYCNLDAAVDYLQQAFERVSRQQPLPQDSLAAALAGISGARSAELAAG